MGNKSETPKENTPNNTKRAMDIQANKKGPMVNDKAIATHIITN